jgi:hypothetical protein
MFANYEYFVNKRYFHAITDALAENEGCIQAKR